MTIEYTNIQSNYKSKIKFCSFAEPSIDVLVWLSATQKDCDFRFKWCGSGGVLRRNDSRWFEKAKLKIKLIIIFSGIHLNQIL